MRKVLFLAVIAVLAFVATGCKNEPSSLKGTWVDESYNVDPDTQVQIKSIWTLTVTGSEETNAAGTLTHVYAGEQFVNENVLVSYSGGKGTLTTAEGATKKMAGTIKAQAKDEVEIDLNDDGGCPILKNGRFVKK